MYKNNEFSRFIPLIGEDKFELIQNKNVLVFGVGGVGGNAVDSLVRCGIKRITIVDNDVVNLSNINRQLIANHNTLGRKKVEVVKDHILSINPQCEVQIFDSFFLSENNLPIDFKNYDYIVDAIDTVTAKVELVKIANKYQTPIISAMGCGNKLNPKMLEVTDIFKTSYDPLCKVMRKKLKNLGIKKLKVVYSKESPIKSNIIEEQIEQNGEKKLKRVPGSCSFVPPVAGLLIASEIINEFIK